MKLEVDSASVVGYSVSDTPDLELGLVVAGGGESVKADEKLVEVLVPRELEVGEWPGERSP